MSKSFKSLWAPSVSIEGTDFSAFVTQTVTRTTSSTLVLWMLCSSSVPAKRVVKEGSFSGESCGVSTFAFLASPAGPVSYPSRDFFSA